MRRTTWLMGTGAALVLIAAQAGLAQTASSTHTNSQQDKMTSCNAEASGKGLKGDDRQAFMKTCLSSKSDAPKGNSQQEKMKSCNATATSKGLKGDDRKAFMQTCLSG